MQNHTQNLNLSNFGFFRLSKSKGIVDVCPNSEAKRVCLRRVHALVYNGIMGGDLIVYQFSREKVEQCDFSHFLGLYAADKLPRGHGLREMMNQFVFCIEGWDHDPREIHLVPDIRRFYSAFHKTWPYWLYFCNLDVDTLRAMTMCCLPSINTMQVDGQVQVKVTCEPLDLIEFIRDDFVPMNLMCERAGMSEREIYDRTKAVLQYFNFPFDAGPPPEKSASEDDLAAHSRISPTKNGRNDPCPCGSGKKYKKCCGKG